MTLSRSNKAIAYLCCLLIPVAGIGQRRYDFNAGCQEAYRSIIQLRLDEGSRLLDAEKKRDPNNLIPYFLDNYVDFFRLFFNEDATQYAVWKGRLDQRLRVFTRG